MCPRTRGKTSSNSSSSRQSRQQQRRSKLQPPAAAAAAAHLCAARTAGCSVLTKQLLGGMQQPAATRALPRWPREMQGRHAAAAGPAAAHRGVSAAAAAQHPGRGAGRAASGRAAGRRSRRQPARSRRSSRRGHNRRQLLLQLHDEETLQTNVWMAVCNFPGHNWIADRCIHSLVVHPTAIPGMLLQCVIQLMHATCCSALLGGPICSCGWWWSGDAASMHTRTPLLLEADEEQGHCCCWYSPFAALAWIACAVRRPDACCCVDDPASCPTASPACTPQPPPCTVWQLPCGPRRLLLLVRLLQSKPPGGDCCRCCPYCCWVCCCSCLHGLSEARGPTEAHPPLSVPFNLTGCCTAALCCSMLHPQPCPPAHLPLCTKYQAPPALPPGLQAHAAWLLQPCISQQVCCCRDCCGHRCGGASGCCSGCCLPAGCSC